MNGPAEHETPRVYLLDAHGLMFQMFHGLPPMSAPDGRPTNAVFGVTRALINLDDQGADYLLAAFDLPDETFRTRIDRDYKAHRPPPPEDLLLQEPMIHQVLAGMRVPMLTCSGFEADDILATLAADAAARNWEVFLCTSDKDCRQLLSQRVRMMNLRKGEIFDEQSLLREWGIRPDQVADFQALVGDSVDNVPGVPGCGPKTASKLLQQYGTLDNIIAHAQELTGPKLREAFLTAVNNGKLEESRQLVKLRTDVPITIDWPAWKRQNWNGPMLLALFQEYGFRSFAAKVRSRLAAAGAERNQALLQALDAPGTRNSPHSTEVEHYQADLEAHALPIKQNRSQAAAAERNQAPFHTPGLRQPTSDPQASLMPPTISPPQASLFDQLAEDESEYNPFDQEDNWSYAGYKLIQTEEDFQSFAKELESQRAFCFDLETTSLDPLRAAIVGIAFCWTPGKAYYLPLRAPAGAATLPEATALPRLKQIFENPAIGKLNQNIKYDWLVLKAHGIGLAGVTGDPMLAHYLLHPTERFHGLDELTRRYLHHDNIPIERLIGKGKKQISIAEVPVEHVRDYACEDADTAWRLHAQFLRDLQRLELDRLYHEVEVPLIGVLTDLEFRGIRVDVPFLNQLSVEMDSQLAEIEREIHHLAGKPFNIASPKQLAKILFADLNLPVQKRTSKNSEPSTDQESLERLAALGHALPRKIIEHRQIAKLKSTYVDALPLLVHERTGRIHTSLNQTITATGRLSSSEPNLQNIPARTEQGRQIRKAFIPEPGWLLLTADYSQIELRMLAHFCGDEVLKTAFEQDADIHTRVAAEIFQIPENQINKQQRALAKTVNFGVIYGMSAHGLAARLGISRTDAEEFIQAYFQRYPKVLAYQNHLLAQARARGYVATILGRRRPFDAAAIRVNSTYQQRNQAEREAINMEIQGSAADLMKLAMLSIHRELADSGLRTRMLLTVHDELIFELPPEELPQAVPLIRQGMLGALQLTVPLKVDLAVGPNWLDVADV